ncbi:MAG: 5'-methylthioadenosine phosphorylase [Gammaproteobacteria bacterium BRH_c0]|nr:MAG: 5'-methylthioadenosine phosphorylase [Gammaproteobacteria bacterium BRH_c0]
MTIGLIGGTALEQLNLQQQQLLEVDTPWGTPSCPLVTGWLAGAQVVYINRHGEQHSIPPHRVNYRANIHALHQQGVDAIVALNAVGGISMEMTPGSLVLPHQLIDYSWGRDHSFSDGDGMPLQHVDFTDPYDQGLRARLLRVATAVALALIDGAVHGVVQGPRLETASEVLRLEKDGCDIVGMTGMPEAGLARELGIPYASIGLVVNPAAGKSDRLITLDEIGAVMKAAQPRLLALIAALCADMAA